MWILLFFVIILIHIQDVHPLVYFYTDNTARDGARGNEASTTSTCTTLAGTQGLSGGSATMLLAYSTRSVSQIQSVTLGFSASEAIYAWSSGTQIATSWTTALSNSGNVLTNSLSTALSISGDAWTGSTTTGGGGAQCNNWASGSFLNTGTVGDDVSKTGSWLASGAAVNCNQLRRQICVYYIAPTASPTSSPTAPTASPTNSPTAPTNSPTKSPTNSPTPPTNSPTAPTNSPTSSPTNSPTAPTRSPTAPTSSPTADPTHEPTQPPTQVIKGRVMYKIAIGSNFGVVRNTKNVNFTLAVPPPQIELSTATTGATATLLPVQWSGLYLRLYNTTSSSTDTYYQEGPCNPAVESIPPGTDGQMLPDGTAACMSVYTCESLGLGSTCSASLNPVGVTPRACLCNITLESLHPYYPSKTLGDTPEEFSLWKGHWTVDNPLPNPFDIFGSIDCRNPIDREVNCQLFCIDPQYPLACTSAPIQCYCSIDPNPPEGVGGQMTVGRFFGLFWDLNPKFTYNIPRSQWGLSHYTGIGSLLNNLMYFTSDNEYQDPFTSQVWKLYYWVNVSSTGFISEAVIPDSQTYSTFILQTSPLQYTQDGTPPLPIDYSLPIGNTPDDDACISGDYSACDITLWSNDAGASFRRPGRELNFAITGTLVTMTMTVNEDINYITGVEVRSPQGGVCGSIFPGNLTAGDEYVFICNNLADNVYTASGWVQVRYFGLNSMYDLPYMLLNEEYQTCEYFDPLSVNLQGFAQYQNLSLPLPLSYVYDLSGNQTWPIWEPFVGYMTITPDITWVMNYTTSASTGSAFLPDEIPNNILTYNQYPYFEALNDRVLAEGYGSRSINYSDPNDLDFLYGVWTTWLAPMQCSEQWQCQTFKQGNCIFPETDFKQRWYNGDADDLYEMVSGKEGGCDCYNSYGEGFFDSQFFCGKCVQGYGPVSLEEWGYQIQLNTLVGGVLFPSDEYPFNLFAAVPTDAPTTSPTKSPTESPTTPTKSPTGSPTSSPTGSPTSSPTIPPGTTASPTKSPTTSPTSSPGSPTPNPTISGSLVFFSDNNLYAANAYPSDALADGFCQSVAPALGLYGNNIRVFRTSPTRAVIAYPFLYGFSTSINVFSTTGVQVGVWSTMFGCSGSGPTALVNSLFTAGVISANTVRFWSGTFCDGGVDAGDTNCNAWTSNSGALATINGISSSVYRFWVASGSSQVCSSTFRILCVQLPDTSSPTTASPVTPSSSPTLSPGGTTPAPTISGSVVLFSDNVLYSADAFPTQALAISHCTTLARTFGLYGTNILMFRSNMSFSISDFPTFYSFSTSTKVFSTSGVLVGTWSSMFDATCATNTLSNSLFTAGVLSTSSANIWWTGSDCSGYGGDPFTCADWRNGFGPSTDAFTGASNAVDYNWIAGSGATCNSLKNFVCAQLPDTGSPTTSPTSSPTKSPTSSPTTSPTASPTPSPTLRPNQPPLTAFPTSSPTTGVPTTPSPTAFPTTTGPTASPVNSTGIPTRSPTVFPTGTLFPTTGPTLSLFESLLQCRLVMGLDPINGGGISVCSGHGTLSLQQTTNTITYTVIGTNTDGGDVFSLCQQGMLIDGDQYDLIEGDYPTRLIQIFSSTTEDYMFLQSSGSGLEVYKTNATSSVGCAITSCSQQLPPVCTLLCDTSEKEMVCLNDDLWVANMDVSLKPIQLNRNILLFSF